MYLFVHFSGETGSTLPKPPPPPASISWSTMLREDWILIGSTLVFFLAPTKRLLSSHMDRRYRVGILSPAMGRGIDSRNRVWNWVAKLHRLAGRYDNPRPTWFLAPIAGLKLPLRRVERWKVGPNIAVVAGDPGDKKGKDDRKWNTFFFFINKEKFQI